MLSYLYPAPETMLDHAILDDDSAPEEGSSRASEEKEGEKADAYSLRGEDVQA